eukprot:scaffold16903_cov133-Isochrysis_galbana.AAC.5
MWMWMCLKRGSASFARCGVEEVRLGCHPFPTQHAARQHDSTTPRCRAFGSGFGFRADRSAHRLAPNAKQEARVEVSRMRPACPRTLA